MIFKCGDTNFKYAWLDYIPQDPVHPGIDAYNRIRGNRAVFVTVENDKPEFIVSVKFDEKRASSVKDVLADKNDSKKCAIFYSIFRVPGNDDAKGKGGDALRSIKDYLKMNGVEEFCTLSPMTKARKHIDTKKIPVEGTFQKYLESEKCAVYRFHIKNGATMEKIHFDADESELRQDQSWGTMVTYRY